MRFATLGFSGNKPFQISQDHIRFKDYIGFKIAFDLKIIQVSFLEIWSLARGACRRFLTVQVTFFVSFKMFLDMIGTVPKYYLVT